MPAFRGDPRQIESVRPLHGVAVHKRAWQRAESGGKMGINGSDRWLRVRAPKNALEEEARQADRQEPSERIVRSNR